MAHVVSTPTRTCPNCRATISASAAICPKCGQQFTPPQPWLPPDQVFGPNALPKTGYRAAWRIVALCSAAAALGWSMLCLAFAISGFLRAAGILQSDPPQNAPERAGAALGMGLGLTTIFFEWAIIAGPLLVINTIAHRYSKD